MWFERSQESRNEESRERGYTKYLDKLVDVIGRIKKRVKSSRERSSVIRLPECYAREKQSPLKGYLVLKRWLLYYTVLSRLTLENRLWMMSTKIWFLFSLFLIEFFSFGFLCVQLLADPVSSVISRYLPSFSLSPSRPAPMKNHLFSRLLRMNSNLPRNEIGGPGRERIPVVPFCRLCLLYKQTLFIFLEKANWANSRPKSSQPGYSGTIHIIKK